MYVPSGSHKYGVALTIVEFYFEEAYFAKSESVVVAARNEATQQLLLDSHP